MRIYYLIAIVANIIAVVAFHKSINISVLSILPLFFIALILFQAALFKKEKIENGFRTAYCSPFTDEEENAHVILAQLLEADSDVALFAVTAIVEGGVVYSIHFTSLSCYDYSIV